MTKHECAVIMAFTGVAMLKGNDLDIFYEYVAKILGRPVYTHEMAMLSEEIKEAARNDFVQLCRNASDCREHEEVKQPKTNGDRIRHLTDEELAEMLDIYDVDEICCYCSNQPCNFKCYNGIIEWLKQEVDNG